MKFVLSSVSDGRATITLNRPEVHNALDSQLIGELRGELARLDQDSQVRVVVIAAAGKSFCAGADLESLRVNLGHSDVKVTAMYLNATNESRRRAVAHLDRLLPAG